MRRYEASFAIFTFLTITAGAVRAQEAAHGSMESRGEHVMGFSPERTRHHFELSQDGGIIEVRTNELADTKTRDQIRGHFRHIVAMFVGGNFSAPMLVHDTDIPGVAAMSRLRGQLHWQLQETPRGARILVVADTRAALDALHQFLRFQISDHKMGDCTAIR